MSKLDNITVDFGYAVGDLGDAPEAIAQIKALVTDMVKQKINIRVSEQFNQNDLQKVVDAVRADLMNKIEAL